MTLQPGAMLHNGSYRIIQTLGHGGFGVTYLAEHVMAERKVCIKEFFPMEYYNRDADSNNIVIASQGSAEFVERYKEKFIKEAKTIAKFDHPNIIRIHDVFNDNNTCYYVMDYVEGESLAQYVKRNGALDEGVAIKYIKDVAAALSCIHEQSINHLDVKPGNIMIRRGDNSAILIDFGLSKHYSKDGSQTSTTPVGISHGFAPMEQYNSGGVSNFSPETDIYSLGATLYYLLTATVPPTASEVAEDGLDFPAGIGSEARCAIERSMEMRRKDRPHSINEFLALLSGGVKSSAPRAPYINSPAYDHHVVPADEKTQISVPQSIPRYSEPQSKKEWTPQYSSGTSQHKKKEGSPGCLLSLITIIFKLILWVLTLCLILGGIAILVDSNGGSNPITEVFEMF